MTLRTIPNPILQPKVGVFVSANITQLGRRKPSVDPHYLFSIAGRQIFETIEKLSEGVLGCLLSESLGYSLEIEILEAKHIVATKELMGKLPLEVLALPSDVSFDTRLGDARLLTIMGSTLLAGNASRSSAELRRSLLQKERCLNVLVVTGSEKRFHPEVKTYGFTRLCYDFIGTRCARHHNDPKVAYGVSLYGQGFNLSFNRTRKMKPKGFFSDSYTITTQAVTGLG